jgi:hypothetical protein
MHYETIDKHHLSKIVFLVQAMLQHDDHVLCNLYMTLDLVVGYSARKNSKSDLIEATPDSIRNHPNQQTVYPTLKLIFFQQVDSNFGNSYENILGHGVLLNNQQVTIEFLKF